MEQLNHQITSSLALRHHTDESGRADGELSSASGLRIANDQKFENSGARPKTNNTQNVSNLNQGLNHLAITPSTSSDRPVSPSPADLRELLRKPRQLLSRIQLPSNFAESSTVSAVEIHLRDEDVDFSNAENQVLLQTAIRTFLARNGNLPKAADLLEEIIDCDFQEENIVKNFEKWAREEFGGIENVPIFRSQLKQELKESGNQRSTDILERTGHANDRCFESTDKLSLEERLKRVLRREKSYLKNRSVCSKCGENPAAVTFLPCTHLVTCTACSVGCRECPICGAKVLAEAKTYLL